VSRIAFPELPKLDQVKLQRAFSHAGKITPMDSDEKRELRKRLVDARPQSSEGLTERLIAIVQKLGAKTIASYSPLPSEPDVTEFNAWAKENLHLLLPRVSGHGLEFAAGEEGKGSFGITEPKGIEVPISEIDLMIVPALAADVAGNRLGKGKGFYDRALGAFSGTSIAVVFDTEVMQVVPNEPHDQKVALVVTPVRTIVVG